MIFERISNFLRNNSYNINISKNYLYINNYIKLDNISEEYIKIILEDIKLEIKGKDIKVLKMIDNEALFKGQIESIILKEK